MCCMAPESASVSTQDVCEADGCPFYCSRSEPRAMRAHWRRQGLKVRCRQCSPKSKAAARKDGNTVGVTAYSLVQKTERGKGRGGRQTLRKDSKVQAHPALPGPLFSTIACWESVGEGTPHTQKLPISYRPSLHFVLSGSWQS